MLIALPVFFLRTPGLFDLFLLPLPAFVDWTLYYANLWSGNNASRILSGAFLGAAYLGFLSIPFAEFFWAKALLPAAFYLGWFMLIKGFARWRFRSRFGD